MPPWYVTMGCLTVEAIRLALSGDRQITL